LAKVLMTSFFNQPANDHPGGGGCPIPWRGSRPSRCFSRSLSDHGGETEWFHPAVQVDRCGWKLETPKIHWGAADSHHFPHCLMIFGNFTVKKKNISFRHVRNLHQMIMLVTSYLHVSPRSFYQSMKPIDGLICLIRRKPLLSEVPEVYHHGGWHLATSWSALWTKDFFEDVLGCPWVSQNEGLTVVEKKHPIGGMVRPFSEKPLFWTSTCNLSWKPQRIPTKNQGRNGVRRCHLSAFQVGCQNQVIQH
jgi:hypothetical protein